MRVVWKTAMLILALFLTLVRVRFSVEANPVPVPIISMPHEYIYANITVSNESVRARVSGNYPFMYNNYDNISISYPVPPDSTAISVKLDGNQTSWWSSNKTYQTMLGDFPMINWTVSPASEQFCVDVDYEHEVPIIDGNCTFLYAMGTWKNLHLAWAERMTAHVTVDININLTSTETLNVHTYEIIFNSTAGRWIWKPLIHTVSMINRVFRVEALVVSEPHYPIEGDFLVTFEKVEKKTVYVPEDHQTIQAALYASNCGDVVYVSNGTYLENVVITKTISLFGENKTSIIEGNADDAVSILADNIQIMGFTIRNSKSSGIYVSQCVNVTIQENRLANNSYGIYLEYSSEDIIKNNIVENNTYGVWVLGSNCTLIYRNEITKNRAVGIELWSSNNNELRENNMQDNAHNLYVYGSSISNFINHIDVSNTANGRPLYYWVNETDRTVPLDAGCVFLINCTRIVVKDLDFAQGGDIFLAYTTNSTITRNSISNGFGIRLFDSSNCIMVRNSITNNEWGVELASKSRNNIIAMNNITTNKQNGIYLHEASNNTVIGNNVTNNKGCGMSLLVSSNNSIAENNIANNFDGVKLNSSEHNKISANTFTNDGLYIFESYQNIVEDNVVNGKPLVYHEDASNLTVNDDAGQVILINCKNIQVEKLSLSNTSVGIELLRTTSCRITNNSLINNNVGIFLHCCRDNSVVGNNIISNEHGIYLYGSFSNSITGNNIINNIYGAYFYFSAFNRICHNNFIGNSQQVHNTSSDNSWDYGYPSGGNYWSNYTGVDTDGDYLGDTPHRIDASDLDRCPLIAPIYVFSAGEWNNATYSVEIMSNSIITNFRFDPNDRALAFNAEGENGTAGFCRVTIPKGLMWCNYTNQWTVTIDGKLISYKDMTQPSQTYLYFAYSHSTKSVKITSTWAVPESLSTIIVLLPITATITILIIRRKQKPT